MRKLALLLAAVIIGCPLTGTGLQAQTAKPRGQVGIVSNVKVLSDKVADVSSLEAWAKSYLKPGMSDREKALAVWRSVVAHQHQNAPPAEFLQSPGGGVLDPIKMFNVYGYSLCSVHAGHVAALARAAGLTARNQTILRHCVAEVWWEGGWHMLDASLVNYFPKPDGNVASVDEIIAAVRAFYGDHPDLRNDPDALDKFRKDLGWKQGPKLLADCPFYDKDGLLPANWPWQCGWHETMREYDGDTQFVWEPGYSMGYRVNVQLRQGERLTRNWFHKGLHVNMDGTGKVPTCLEQKVGEGPMCYTPWYGDLSVGRIGNGVLEYNVPLASSEFRGGAMIAENLAAKLEDGKAPAVHVQDPARPGVLVIRMPSSYVYLTGTLVFDAVAGDGGKITVSFSDNNGLDWKEVQSVASTGKQSIDLKPLIFRRYDYRLKFEMTGAGTGLDALCIRHDIQHSQRPLPALAHGENIITFSAGPDEGTTTIEGSTQLGNRGKQVLYTDFHPQKENIAEPMISIKGSSGAITFPVTTPGAIKRLRIFAFYRTLSDGDRWDVATSFDDGKTFTDAGRLEGPFKAMGKQIVVADVPNAATSALVRFTGTRHDTAMLFNVRIDADYEEPQGGWRPIKVTYVWEENGLEKRDAHVALQPEDHWIIRCDARPVMKSLIVEPAGPERTSFMGKFPKDARTRRFPSGRGCACYAGRAMEHFTLVPFASIQVQQAS